MPTSLVQIVSMLLLIVQGVVALAPGRMLCIPVWDCGTHEQAPEAACAHSDPGSCPPSACSSFDEERGRFADGRGQSAPLLAPIDECGCHLHVQVPGHQPVPFTPRDDDHSPKACVVPVVATAVMDWRCDPPSALVACLRPPDFSVSGQVLALKSTRLLI